MAPFRPADDEKPGHSLKCRPGEADNRGVIAETLLPYDMGLRLMSLLDQTPCVAAMFDEHDVLQWANPAFRVLFGVAERAHPTWAEMMRASHAEAVAPATPSDDFEQWLAAAALCRGKLPFRAFEVDSAGGRWSMMTETVGAEGWTLCFGMEVADVSRNPLPLGAALTAQFA